MSYFDKFPTIFYNGQQGKNLLARAKLTPEVKKNISMYYPYTIKDGDGRPDVLSYAYYNNPADVWMLYFANEVVDPYYDLGLPQEDFLRYIADKYGSIERAQSSIEFYRTNWMYLDDTSITIDNYELLDPSEKSYWEPVLDNRATLVNYRRKREDIILNTNRILEVTVADPSVFIKGERVSLVSNPHLYAFVLSATDSLINIQHVNGFTPDVLTGQVLRGSDSGSEQTVTSAKVLVENITQSVESKYWSPVTCYENEEEVNTLKRNIQIIDARYKNQLEDDLRKVMQS